eukprot:14003640-Alexandrium_andersonii.AAC.1
MVVAGEGALLQTQAYVLWTTATWLKEIAVQAQADFQCVCVCARAFACFTHAHVRACVRA